MTNEALTATGMTTGEIVTAVLAVIGIVLGILKVWIQSQTDIAKIQIQIAEVNKRCDQGDEAMRTHKAEEHARYEEMRKENREDHRLLFNKFDEFLKTQIPKK